MTFTQRDRADFVRTYRTWLEHVPGADETLFEQLLFLFDCAPSGVQERFMRKILERLRRTDTRPRPEASRGADGRAHPSPVPTRVNGVMR